ncbi:Signal transduction histidine kinase [Actinokineospora alba]|uniref:Signal transduction histidine-protein kinase/phosphatase MprB n=1 Tax=Actinokineospora alba TaxID=504798 RepID=A0A1H0L4F9_9PSEU|nr:HAMP domain-containing sensor histidine kinase [Actinokineospora alba]TDP67202.1 signal transduction histidine kinase [Actinokineospora alba]SDJ04607.1 Signal transduction histidine kinase [Actinokineospora alba]SDO63164.1 Signal transduction histidine kinase [Actinokineospora alba]
MTRLARRAVLVACTVLTVLLVSLTVVLAVSHERDLVHEKDFSDATIVAEVLAATQDKEIVRAAIGRTPAGRSGRLEARLAHGGVLGMSNGDPAVVLPVRAADGGNAVVSVVSAPIPFPHGKVILALFVAAAGMAGAVPLGLRPLRPIGRALTTLTEVALDGGRRLRVKGPRELEELGEAINATADRTDEMLAKERKMIADVSHRLRTPLTALRLDAEAIGSGDAADRVRVSVETLEHDVNQIIHSLQLSTVATAKPRCDLAAAVAERMMFWSAHAETQLRSFEVTLTDGPAKVPLARDRVEAVVDTLLANVFQHTPPSAPIAVQVVRHAGWITLVVEDGGPGFADPSGALLRGASGCGSTGLGLDIARSAVESTGGRIIVDKGQLGGARIRLKMAEADREQRPEDPRAWRLWSKNHRRPRPQ